MENKLTNPSQTVFEQIKEVDENGNEFWTARTELSATSPNNRDNPVTVIRLPAGFDRF